MRKRKYQTDEKVIAQRIDEGRGQGKGSFYKPWLTVFNVPSLGRCHRILGHTTGRVQHFLSDLEAYFFHLNEFSDRVFDIREQYPLLPRDETIEIADELGIKHPADPSTKCKIVMTTDQLLTLPYLGGEKYQAVSIKYSQELEKPRVIEKLEIEKRYWKRRNIECKVVTEKDINRTIVDNIRWFHPYYFRSDLYPLTDSTITSGSKELTEQVLSQEEPLCQIASRLDEKKGLPTGSSLAIARHLLATQQWVVNLETRINPREIFSIHKSRLNQF